MVCTSGDCVAATASLQQDHLGEISVAVHPDHRKSGHASKLVSAIEAQAITIGVDVIKAMIWVENHPSRSLFNTLGYEHKATLMAEFKSDKIGEIDDAVYYKRL